MKKSSYTTKRRDHAPNSGPRRGNGHPEPGIRVSIPSDNSQQANIGRSHLNYFAHNLESEVRRNLVPQYDHAIVEMTRWLEGYEAAEGEKQGQVEE